jgi:hypothetical protein
MTDYTIKGTAAETKIYSEYWVNLKMKSILNLAPKNLEYKWVFCPCCDEQVRHKDLREHCLKIHQITPKVIAWKPKLRQASWCKAYQLHLQPGPIVITPLTNQVYSRVISILERWMNRKEKFSSLIQKNGFLESLADTLFTHPSLGYSFDDVNIFRDGVYGLEQYQILSAEMKPLIEKILDDTLNELRSFSLHEFLHLHHEISYVLMHERDDYREAWHEVNTLDQMDSGRYIGYLAREYKDSRYGTLPLHDDYGDESWPDQNPWGE